MQFKIVVVCLPIILVLVSGVSNQLLRPRTTLECVIAPTHGCMELRTCLKIEGVPMRTLDCFGGVNVICCFWDLPE